MEALHAGVAGDLERGGGRGGAEPPGGDLLHPLHPLHLLAGTLPDHPGARELPLGELQLPLGQLPDALRVGALRRRHPRLLRRLLLHGADVHRHLLLLQLPRRRSAGGHSRRRSPALVRRWSRRRRPWQLQLLLPRPNAHGQVEVQLLVVGGGAGRRFPEHPSSGCGEQQLEPPLPLLLHGRSRPSSEVYLPLSRLLPRVVLWLVSLA
uniref:Uncharacterized protein n=1 Tax=Triticum urartu TaxID=4572 RepID=A0A8R7TI05_TRIUA